jgi:hypothetical protein
MKLQLPESVHRFCTDGRTASAVRLLLSGKSPKVPDGLQWGELEDFYRACLAAQQTRIEWAIVMWRLWEMVFSDQLPGWRPSTIRKQADDSDIDIGIASLWEDGEFTRDFTRGDFFLQLQIEFNADEGVRANASLWRDGRAAVLSAPPRAETVGEWVCSRWVQIEDGSELDVSGLRETACIAIEEASLIAAAEAW